jgi:hypothetical protein
MPFVEAPILLHHAGGLVPHIDALHEINHALGDIPRVVADALQAARGDQVIERRSIASGSRFIISTT